MAYSDVMLEEGRKRLGQEGQEAATNISWNYYSQFGGTGIETPALRLAMYNLGKKQRRTEDNLNAWYQTTKKQEDLQEKWRKMWEDEQRKREEDANKTDWGSILGGIAGGVGGFFAGGPAGAMAGYSLGSGVGTQF